MSDIDAQIDIVRRGIAQMEEVRQQFVDAGISTAGGDEGIAAMRAVLRTLMAAKAWAAAAESIGLDLIDNDDDLMALFRAIKGRPK